MKYPTEQIFANLLTLIAGTKLLSGVPAVPSGPAVFQTASRRLPQVSNVASILQPAVYFIQGEVEAVEKVQGAQYYNLGAGVVVLFRNTGGPNEVASTQMNNLWDAVRFQVQQRTLAPDFTTIIPLLGGQRQHLGGVCYHASIRSRIMMNEGLQNGQGAIVFMVSILQPM